MLKLTGHGLTGCSWDTRRATALQIHDYLDKNYRVNLSGTIPAPKVVKTDEDARQLSMMLESSKVVAIDTEFDGEGRMVTWQASNGHDRWVIPVSDLRLFRSWLESDARKVFHHMRADAPIFRYAGIDIKGFHADTMVMDWLVDENRDRHGLKPCAGEWLGIPLTEYVDTFGEVPEGKKKPVVPDIWEVWKKRRKIFVDYASADAYATYWLYVHHRTILQRLKIDDTRTLWDFYKAVEREFTETLLKMGNRGIRVDADILRDIGESLMWEMRRARHIFVLHAPAIRVERKRAGQPFVEVIQPHNINLKSVQQLQALFYGELKLERLRNKKTALPTDAEQLEVWGAQNNVLAKMILVHRRAGTMRGTFIGDEEGKGLLSHLVKEEDYQVVDTDLIQIGTVTGRISSRRPNLQNIPARKDKDPYRIRRAFIARPGYKLVVADYSMFELRVMAHLSADRRMCKALREGIDLHSLTAKNCWGLKCKIEEVRKRYSDIRQSAKSINFGIQYGMQAGLLAKSIACSYDQAQSYIDAYFDLYPGVYFWMNKIVEQCKKLGYVTTLLGRRRRVPELQLPATEENKGMLKHAANQAMNAPIQGGVADIMRLVMNKIEADQFLRDHEASLLLQVHDEVIVECPAIYATDVQDRVKEIMETAYKLRVPTIVDAHIADNWEDAKG